MDTATHANRALARTITIGLDLGAELERGWALPDPVRYLPAIREAGFTAVRVAVVWAAHSAATPPYTVDPAALEAVFSLACAASELGLAFVVDNHLDPALMADPPAHRERLLAVTRQVAAHLRGAPGTLLLEPLAEPRDALDRVWNSYLADLVGTVRDVDAARTLVVGPAFYNTVFRLDELVLPRDDRLILSVHQYWPIPFTMQGEEWFADSGGWEWLGGGGPTDWRGTTWRGSDHEVDELTTGYDRLAAWAAGHTIPVFVGEFGASAHADPASRAEWARANRRLAERRGFSWGWWSFAPTFALYDTTTDQWDAGLLSALMDRVSEKST